MGGNNKIYWDACIFLAYIKAENRLNPRDLPGIEEQVALIDDRKVELVTSVITLIEVLSSSLSVIAQNTLTDLFKKRNIHLIDLTKEIANLSHEIRNHYYSKANGNPIISTPDVIHLATAIQQKCQKFFTFDGSDEKDKRGLLSLPIPIIGKYQIGIERPIPGTQQIAITFPVNSDTNEPSKNELED